MQVRSTASILTVLATLVVNGFSGTATATLISRNDPKIVITSPRTKTGLDNLLYDTDTHFEWLDISASFNLSVRDVVGSGTINAVAMFPGFRVAAIEEIEAFVIHAGIIYPNNVQFEDSAAIRSLQDRIGKYFRVEPHGVLYETAMESSSRIGSNHFGIDIGDAVSIKDGAGEYSMDPETGRYPWQGIALLRLAVPEPSTLALAALGILGLLIAARRRR